MDRDKSLDMTLGQIEKQYGKGAIMRLGERGNVGIEAVPTGALALDLALGIGGLPRGRIVEIYGPESSGKSTLATHVVAEAQRNGGVCAYIDAEHVHDWRCLVIGYRLNVRSVSHFGHIAVSPSGAYRVVHKYSRQVSSSGNRAWNSRNVN